MNEYTTNHPNGTCKPNSPPQISTCPLHTYFVSDTDCKRCGHLNGYHLDGCANSKDEPPKRNLEQQLCDVLINHTGEHGQNEGAVECLERIIRERDLLLKMAVEVMLKPAHF